MVKRSVQRSSVQCSAVQCSAVSAVWECRTERKNGPSTCRSTKERLIFESLRVTR